MKINIIELDCMASILLGHTSLEPLIRKNKCSRQTANAGDLHLLLERWGDASELFWMGDFGDIPKKTLNFSIFGAHKTNFWSQKVYFASEWVFWWVILKTFLVWSYNFGAGNLKKWLILA